METEVRTRKGIPNLSENIKLGILQQKKLQMVPQHIIANDFNVSRKTVNQLDENDLSPQAKAKLDSFVEKLGQAREKVIQRINEKLDNNDFKDGVYPNLLNAVNNNFRLETNQSTANINVNDSAINTLIAKGIVASIEDAKALLNSVIDGELIEGELD